MMDRMALRAHMRGIRKSLPPQAAAQQAANITAQVLAWPVFEGASSVMLYMPMPGEVDVRPLAQAVLAGGKTLLLPRCGAAPHMDAVRVDDLSILSPGTLRILEPGAGFPPYDPMAIRLVLAPGVAFDCQGNRLGQGKAYYDHFLSRTGALRAGVCFSEQVLPSLPALPHDIPMNYLVTPQGIFTCAAKEDV